MANVAELGIKIDTKQVDAAAKDLNQLSGAAKEAQAASEKLSMASSKLTAAQQSVNAATERLVNGNSRLALLKSNLVALQNTEGASAKMVAAAQMKVASAESTLTGQTNALIAAKHRLVAAEEAVARATVVSNTAQNRVNLGQINSTKVVQQLTRDNRMLAFQLNDVAVSLASGMNPMMVAIQQGSQISQLYAGQGGVAMAFKQTGVMARGAAAAIAGFALANPLAIASAAALGLGLRSVVNELDAAGYASIGYGDVAVAAFQVVGDGISSVLLPAIQAISPATTSVLDATAGFFKDWGNSIIRLALGSFEVIKTGIMSLPDAFAAAGAAAANVFLGAIDRMVKKAQSAIQSLMNYLNSALPSNMQLGISTKSGNRFRSPERESFGPPAPPTGLGLGRFDTDGALTKLEQSYLDLDATATKIMNTDYLGQFGDAIKAKAISNELAGVEKAAGGAGNALKKAATEAKDPWDKLRSVSPDVTANMDEIKKKMEAVAQAGQQLGQGLGGVFKGLIDGTMDWKEAAISAFKSVLQYFNQTNIAGGGSGLFGGGFLQSFLGGFMGLSFDGGGDTGNGPRTGGIDGKGGFPAILHPQETIIDRTKGQRSAANSNAVNMPITINAPGADAAALARVQMQLRELGKSIPSMVDGRIAHKQYRGGRA